MSIRRTLTTVAATMATSVAAFTVGAGPAVAQEPEATVDLIGCVFEGGETETGEGPAIGFINGWGSGTRGLVTAYLTSQETTVTVQYNDEPATTLDLSDEYTRPHYNEEFGGWTSELRLPMRDLAVGDTVVVGIEITLKHPVMDFLRGENGYNFPPEGNLVPAGTQLSGTCTITVVEN